jgi:GNAT superfamily N-acetyltransferase
MKALWEAIFHTAYDGVLPILRGAELPDNRDVFLIARENGALAGTCHLTISRAQPELGGLGEVAVLEAYRGKGIGSQLCAMARDLFFAQNGRALFLGTRNPVALRIYQRLGWRLFAGTEVMVAVCAARAPDLFLAEYFSGMRTGRVASGGAQDRIPLIPLVVAPHPWHVLDANAGICSTRFTIQTACMGLFPRYAALREQAAGTWFTLLDESGRLAGIASVVMQDAAAGVDGFTHPLAQSAWPKLLHVAVQWAAQHGARVCHATVAAADADKQALFRPLGFTVAGAEEVRDFPGCSIRCLRLSRRCGTE